MYVVLSYSDHTDGMLNTSSNAYRDMENRRLSDANHHQPSVVYSNVQRSKDRLESSYNSSRGNKNTVGGRTGLSSDMKKKKREDKKPPIPVASSSEVRISRSTKQKGQ